MAHLLDAVGLLRCEVGAFRYVIGQVEQMRRAFVDYELVLVVAHGEAIPE